MGSTLDTNLKDFQRLSEWASGFHLPEDKIVSLGKTISKETEMTTETSTTTETYSPPKDAQQISRRMGAESLQVAAIYQLQAFMRGAYGEQFMKPAFHLLHSIWEGLMRPLLPPENQTLNEEEVRIVQKLIEAHRKRPIFKAINHALVGDRGMTLRLFSDELAGLFLAGISADTRGLKSLKLAGVRLDGVDLRWSSLFGASLAGSSMIAVNFSHSNLQFVSLRGVWIRYCKFKSASMNNSMVEKSNIVDTDLRAADLERSNLSHSKMVGVDLRAAKLNGTRLVGAILEHSYLSKIELDEVDLKYTSFSGSQIQLEDKNDISQQQKIMLKAGAILIDPKTGEPIDPP